MTEPRDEATVSVTEIAAERDDRKREERGNERKIGREAEDELVCLLGQKVFLEEQLGSVCEGLEKSERTGLVGSDAVLHSCDCLALEPHHEHRGNETHDEDDENLQQDDE